MSSPERSSVSGAAPNQTATFEEDMASVDYDTIEGMIRTWLDTLTKHNALEEMPVSLEAKSAAKKLSTLPTENC